MTPDCKSRNRFHLGAKNLLDRFLKDEKRTEGLTPSREEWLRGNEGGGLLSWLPAPPKLIECRLSLEVAGHEIIFTFIEIRLRPFSFSFPYVFLLAFLMLSF